MIEAALIRECADPALKPAIVEQFIERAGSTDPLAVTIRSGNRLVLVPKPRTAEEALGLIRDHLGRNAIRVGITQYPAGLGIVDAGPLKPDLVDACENIRLGTALFAKVYRIVAKWYGNPTEKSVLPQVFDDAIIAWQTGYFEGVAVFTAKEPDPLKPDDVKLAQPERDDREKDASGGEATDMAAGVGPPAAAPVSDPNAAGIRIDLSGIGAGH